MDKWLATFEDKVAKSGINLHLITKYVDNVLIVCNNLRLGEYWEDEQIKFSKELEERHIRDQTSRSEVTYEALKAIANSILDFVQFTGEFSDHLV